MVPARSPPLHRTLQGGQWHLATGHHGDGKWSCPPRESLSHAHGRGRRRDDASERSARVNAFFGWFTAQAGVLNPEMAVSHWGYAAVFVLVILGNAGVPVPEETVLVVAGFLVWRGQMRLDLVLAVGIVSAVLGDNLGYWAGRRFGRGALVRHAHWILGHPERLGAMQRFVKRRGALAVFVARFVPGLRFTAGPLAGALGLGAWSFLAGNVLGAAVYVPTM